MADERILSILTVIVQEIDALENRVGQGAYSELDEIKQAVKDLIDMMIR